MHARQRAPLAELYPTPFINSSYSVYIKIHFYFLSGRHRAEFVWVGAHWAQNRALDPLELELGSCEPPDVGDRNLGLWKNCKFSFLLSHLSSSLSLVFQLRVLLAWILRLGVIWFFAFCCCCCSELGLLYYNYIRSVKFQNSVLKPPITHSTLCTLEKQWSDRVLYFVIKRGFMSILWPHRARSKGGAMSIQLSLEVSAHLF